MASLTGGFAPIAGASKDKSADAKKSDLTGGLIGIGSNSSSARRTNSDDLDFSDFNVDDLLLDDGDSKPKSKSKSSKTTKAPSPSSPASPKKKKSSSKSSSGSKKKGDKKKSSSSALESFNDDDWDNEEVEEEVKKPAKKMSAFDMDDFIAPVKKNAKLDDEFARMLGLEDELLGRRSDSSTVEDVVEVPEFPVRRSPPKDTSTARRPPSPPPKEETVVEGGLSAAFFEDESTGKDKREAVETDGGSSVLSFLSTGSERRGGRGAGRRNGTEKSDLFADPFDKSESTKSMPSALDELFSSSSSRGSAKASSTNPSTSSSGGRSTLESLFGKTTEEPASKPPVDQEDPPKPAPRVISTGSSKPVASSAKDDLLAELFPTEEPPRPPKRTVKDEAEQHDDLLAELFPVEKPKPKQAPSPPLSKVEPVRTSQVPEVEPAKQEAPRMEVTSSSSCSSYPSSQPSAKSVMDTDSARDSLLKDLLPDSPPRSRHTARAATETVEEEERREPSYDRVKAPSPPPPPATSTSPPPEEPIKIQPLPPPPASAEVPSASPPKPQQISTAPSPPPTLSPPPSPGKTKTLAIGTPSKVREVEFEQSKDELLEEILSSAPPSPARAPPSPPSRRSSFEPFEPSSSSLSHRASRSTERPPPLANSAPPLQSHSSPPRQSVSSPPLPPPSLSQPVVMLQRDTQAEERLLREHATVLSALAEQHACALADRDHQLLSASSEIQQLRQQLAETQSALSSLRHQHSLLSSKLELADADTAALRHQLQQADADQLALTTQLADEQHRHAATKLALADFKRESESAANKVANQQRAQLDRLYQQLQTSLTELQVVHTSGSEDAVAERERDASTRLRILHTVEATARGLAHQAEDECQRLTTLLGTLETTLRASRQENLEEKERLRQEQRRLDALAQHFQAQSSVLHASADANAQLLGSQLAQSLQDVRTADARLHARRQQLQRDAQQLHDQRCEFAAHREQWLEQRDREAVELQSERMIIQREWQALQSDKEALEDVLAAHDEAFQSLKMQRAELEREKERVAAGARHVAELAAQCDALAANAAAQEQARRQERTEYEELRRQSTIKDERLLQERRELQQREQRLHAQLRHAELAQRKAVEERRARLQQTKSGKPPGVDPCSYATCDTSSPTLARTRTPTIGTTPTFERMPTPTCTLAPTPTLTRTLTTDPAGFSPAFRELVEANWQQQQHSGTSLAAADAALLRERMRIHCLGLDTRPTSERSPSVLASATATNSNSSVPTATAKRLHISPPPPPPLPTVGGKPSVGASASVAAPRLVSIHL